MIFCYPKLNFFHFEPFKSLADCLNANIDGDDQVTTNTDYDIDGDVPDVTGMNVKCTATVAVLGSAWVFYFDSTY